MASTHTKLPPGSHRGLPTYHMGGAAGGGRSATGLVFHARWKNGRRLPVLQEGFEPNPWQLLEFGLLDHLRSAVPPNAPPGTPAIPGPADERIHRLLADESEFAFPDPFPSPDLAPDGSTYSGFSNMLSVYAQP